MASGRIEENKIIVTGFTTNTATTLNKEELYSVVVSGASTAELSPGAILRSNKAFIRREKHAYIKPGDIESTEGLCSSITISTKNIKKDSLYIVGVPGFISSYEFKKLDDEQYVLELCSYPNYDEPVNDTIVIGGYDIYGNIILSDEIDLTWEGGLTYGSVILFYESDGEESSEKSVTATETSLEISYVKTDNVIPDTLDILVKSDDLNVVSFQKADNFGKISVSFPSNGSKILEKEYTIQIFGLNEYGDRVISNVFKIVQGKRDESSRFYVDGVDIEHNATEAVFNVHYPANITNIGVYYWSNTIISEPSYAGGSKVRATVNVNNGPQQKALSITMSGKTENGKIVYADGTIFQKPGAYLLIDENGGVQSATTTIKHYTQAFSFKYKSLNITNITVSGNADLLNNGGLVSLNKSRRTVNVSFRKNEGNTDKEYSVTIKGKTPTGAEVSAVYFITHGSSTGSEFTLLYNGAASHTFPYHLDDNKFVLDVNFPSDYDRIGVYQITSTSSQYKIYNYQFSTDRKRLECYVHDNIGVSESLYTVTVSGITPDNKVVYTNEFRATHNPKDENSWLKLNETAATVSSETERFEISFSYSNMAYIYVDSCIASDGSRVDVSNLSYSGGAGSFVLNFTKYYAGGGGDKIIPESKTGGLTGNTVNMPLGNTSYNYFPALQSIEHDVHEYNYATGDTGWIGLEKIPTPTPDNRIITVKIKGTDNKGRMVPADPNDGNCIFTLTQTGEFFGIRVVPDVISVGNNVLTVTGFNVIRNGVEPLAAIYNDTIFSGVTDTGATLLSANMQIDEVVNKITYRGRASDGIIVSADLTVKQKGAPANPSIVISSTPSLYDSENDVYLVGVKAGSYALKILNIDIVGSSLSGFTDNQEHATANTITKKVSLAKVEEGGGSGRTSVTGNVVSDTAINAAIGNNSTKYTPKLVRITKDVYEYWVKLDDYSGDEVSVDTRIWVKGIGYDGNMYQSNTITFRQTGKVNPDGGDTPTPTPSSGISYIDKDWDPNQQNPNKIPSNGYTGVTATFMYRNIDESSFTFEHDSYISDIEIIELGVPFTDLTDGGRKYQAKIRFNVGENPKMAGEGYNYIKISGVSTLDGSIKQYDMFVNQDYYSYVWINKDDYDFYPDINNGLLVIRLDVSNIDPNYFEYGYYTDDSSKTNEIEIPATAVLETVRFEDGSTARNEMTYSEAIPIELKHDSNGYYIKVRNQVWIKYDSRNPYGFYPIKLYFKDLRGNTLISGFTLERISGNCGHQVCDIFLKSSQWWWGY